MHEPFIFSSLIQQGYKLWPAEGTAAEGGHRLFGPHAIPGATCPNCRGGFLGFGHKPLLHLATIHTRDPRLGLDLPLAEIPLLYCTRCMISEADGNVNIDGLRRHGRVAPGKYHGDGSEFFYHVGEATVTILVYNAGYEPEFVPYPDYPDFFPGTGARLEALSADEQWYCERSNRYDDEHPDTFNYRDAAPGDITAHLDAMRAAARAFEDECGKVCTWLHQLGGEPNFANFVAMPNCPCCDTPMPFLAVIEDNPSAGTPDLSGSAYFQIVFYYCAACSVVGAYAIGT
jgi:hypothetical protein